MAWRALPMTELPSQKPAHPGYSRSFKLLIFSQFLAALAVTLCALWPPATTALLRNMHLDYEHYSIWALFQPLPKMYHSDNALRTDSLGDFFHAEPTRFNHYPIRPLTFSPARLYLATTEAEGYLFISSQYRQTCLVTAYQVEATASPAKVTATGVDPTTTASPLSPRCH